MARDADQILRDKSAVPLTAEQKAKATRPAILKEILSDWRKAKLFGVDYHWEEETLP